MSVYGLDTIPHDLDISVVRENHSSTSKTLGKVDRTGTSITLTYVERLHSFWDGIHDFPSTLFKLRGVRAI